MIPIFEHDFANKLRLRTKLQSREFCTSAEKACQNLEFWQHAGSVDASLAQIGGVRGRRFAEQIFSRLAGNQGLEPLPRNHQTEHLGRVEHSASAWFDDHTGAPVEAKLRKFSVALFKSKTVLPEMLRCELFQRLLAYWARNFTFTDIGDLYLLQGLLQKLPTQIDLGAQRFR